MRTDIIPDENLSEAEQLLFRCMMLLQKSRLNTDRILDATYHARKARRLVIEQIRIEQAEIDAMGMEHYKRATREMGNSPPLQAKSGNDGSVISRKSDG